MYPCIQCEAKPSIPAKPKQAKQTAERSVRGYTIELERILTQFRDAESALSMAHTELKQCDDRTQDILHDLELNDHTYHERGKLTTELVEIRRRRRVAKDTIELLNPLCTWLTNNSKQIHMLESVLGEMRKIDTKRDNRQYWPKSMASSEQS